MPKEKPPELARCDEHGLVLIPEDGAHHTWCAACETGIEVRLDDEIPGGSSLNQEEFTGRLEADTIEELVPMFEKYLDDVTDQEVQIWVTHEPWSGKLPAGYTEQERFIPVIGYAFPPRVKYLTMDNNGRESIQTLKENGYGDAGE